MRIRSGARIVTIRLNRNSSLNSAVVRSTKWRSVTRCQQANRFDTILSKVDRRPTLVSRKRRYQRQAVNSVSN